MPEITRVTANGLTFGALTWGDPRAPLALCLHGYPDTAHTWRHLGPHLAGQGWRVVAPFTRGYGPTSLAPDDRYLIADLANDALALHAALGGDDRAVLIGHDWGAVTASAVGAQAPRRFAKLVTLSVPPTPALLKPFYTPSALGLAGRQARMSWYFVYNQLPVERTLDRIIPKLWRDWSPGYDATEDLAHVFDALRGPGRRRAALRYYRNNLAPRALAKTFTVSPRQPVLYLHGEQDGCMTPDLIRRSPSALPPGSRVEHLAGVGHFLQLEDPETVNGLITEWVGAPP
jgi:pimeloyl-ACP methyl ester carboxylesterase